MYWSDGRIQSSVSDGSSAPVNLLDSQCQLHDAAYNRSTTNAELDVADTNFYKNTNKLGFRGRIYGPLVYYGNKLLRMGNALEVNSSNNKNVRGFLRWVHENDKVSPAPAEGNKVTPGDGDSIQPGLTSTTYHGTCSVEDLNLPVGSYSSSGFSGSNPFTSGGLYKPLGRKRKRKRQKRTPDEYYQLLSALSRVTPSLQK
jgi:hypothetical protein